MKDDDYYEAVGKEIDDHPIGVRESRPKPFEACFTVWKDAHGWSLKHDRGISVTAHHPTLDSIVEHEIYANSLHERTNGMDIVIRVKCDSEQAQKDWEAMFRPKSD